jgi:D-threo-aldose 1-dehydrogenase
VIRRVQLSGTEVTTTSLGLGCANLFRLPSRNDRLRILAAAFEGGVRHFDTAPMYGLGMSEPELGRFARGHRDEVVIATKFGIDLTMAARALSRAQAPIRRLLAAAPALQLRARTNAASPGSGRAGAFLYEARGHTARAARSSLERSLRDLRTGYVDLLLLHDPAPGSIRSDDVCAFLDAAQRSGEIRAWGIAGEVEPSLRVAAALGRPVPVLQLRDDVLVRSSPPTSADELGAIAFGVLARALPALLTFVRSAPARRRDWFERVGTDCGDPDAAASLLLREAMAAHRSGVVLFSTIRPERLDRDLRAAENSLEPEDPELTAFRHLIATELLPAMGSRP